MPKLARTFVVFQKFDRPKHLNHPGMKLDYRFCEDLHLLQIVRKLARIRVYKEM